jgi:hypothetical protein
MKQYKVIYIVTNAQDKNDTGHYRMPFCVKAKSFEDAKVKARAEAIKQEYIPRTLYNIELL